MSGYIAQVFSLGYVGNSDDDSVCFVSDQKHARVFSHTREAIDLVTDAGWDPDAFQISPFDGSFVPQSEKPFSSATPVKTQRKSL